MPEHLVISDTSCLALLTGIISQVKPLFDKIQQTNFRVSEKIIEEALKEASE